MVRIYIYIYSPGTCDKKKRERIYGVFMYFSCIQDSFRHNDCIPIAVLRRVTFNRKYQILIEGYTPFLPMICLM